MRYGSGLMRRSIAIAGNMGSGKSTLVEFLARTYGVVPFYEPNDENPYLADFYKDMKGWAFQSQLYFLANKFRLHQELDRQPGVVALDRTIFEDAEIFATALHQMRKISKRDWQTYQSFYNAILDAIRPLSYLKRLERLYDEWIDSYAMSDILVLETDKLDYINDLIHRLDVMERIEAVLPDEIGKPPCQ